jgi:hypothetical protein
LRVAELEAQLEAQKNNGSAHSPAIMNAPARAYTQEEDEVIRLVIEDEIAGMIKALASKGRLKATLTEGLRLLGEEVATPAPAPVEAAAPAPAPEPAPDAEETAEERLERRRNEFKELEGKMFDAYEKAEDWLNAPGAEPSPIEQSRLALIHRIKADGQSPAQAMRNVYAYQELRKEYADVLRTRKPSSTPRKPKPTVNIKPVVSQQLVEAARQVAAPTPVEEVASIEADAPAPAPIEQPAPNLSDDVSDEDKRHLEEILTTLDLGPGIH